MIDIIEYTGTPEDQVRETVFELYRSIFSSEPNEEAQERLLYSRDLLILLAYNEAAEAVAFKVGYRQDPDTFYSWLGGVLPDYRGQHLATRLMARQHEWAQSQGYRFIQTKTLNRWRDMLILNLRHGFSIMGTYVGKDGRLRIILEKEL
jgi:predicted GNAT superfamily acetyltransferase